MAPVWNLLFLTVRSACIIMLHSTDLAVFKLTEGSGPIYGTLLMVSVSKLGSTASSSTCFDRSIPKLRSNRHVYRESIGINVAICWRQGASYCQRSRVGVRVVDPSCRKTRSNHCIFVKESYFGHDDNKKRDFVFEKLINFDV